MGESTKLISEEHKRNGVERTRLLLGSLVLKGVHDSDEFVVFT